METEQISALAITVGSFVFIATGLCLANSIEAHESELTANILTAICAIGALSVLIGLILYIISLFN